MDSTCRWGFDDLLHFVVVTPYHLPVQTLARSITITPLFGMLTSTGVRLVCPKCGSAKKSGKRSCCAPGGAWFKNCGDAGDTEVDHTWAEGVQACKSALSTGSLYAIHCYTCLLVEATIYLSLISSTLAASILNEKMVEH